MVNDMETLNLLNIRLTGWTHVLSTLLYMGGLAWVVFRAEFLAILEAPTNEMLAIVVRHVPAYQWGFALMSAGVIVTVLGLGMLSKLLAVASNNFLPQLAIIAFAFGAVLWVIDLAFEMSVTPSAAREFARTGEVPAFFEPLWQWGEMMLRIYTVLAFLAIAGYGWALLQTGLLPQWVGWVSIAWSVFWLGHFIVIQDTIPLLHHVIPLVIGIALILQRVAVSNNGSLGNL
jgi:hypothetical protein